MRIICEDVQYVDILDYVKSATDDYSKMSGIIFLDTLADVNMAEIALKPHYNNIRHVIINNKYQVLYSNEEIEESLKKKKPKVGFGGLELVHTPGSKENVDAFNNALGSNVSAGDGPSGDGGGMGEGLEETYEKHDDLNNDLFENGELKPEVKDKLTEIANDFIGFVKDNKVDIDIKDILLVGSNASYNYTDNSDIDCHIVVSMDESNIDKLYDAYRRIWNSTYSPEIYGHEVRIYVEPEGHETKSNGVYSINNGWIKEPSDDMPETIETDITDWLKRADECNTKEDIDNYLVDLYKMRQEGLMRDGEYSIKNQTFKDIRDTGIIKTLKNRLVNIKNKELSLVDEDITKLNAWRT